MMVQQFLIRWKMPWWLKVGRHWGLCMTESCWSLTQLNR